MASEVAGPAFGAMLRRLRLEADLSQELLAERARMSVDAISTLERGTRRSPQRQTLALLVDALGLDGARRKEFEAAAARTPSERTRGRPATSVHRPAAARNHNLPFPLNSFVGRDDERAALAERLSNERLITLAGTGGVGKTRLAIEIGHAVVRRTRRNSRPGVDRRRDVRRDRRARRSGCAAHRHDDRRARFVAASLDRGQLRASRRIRRSPDR
jgi:transcriptional regulator with XRE-family HTH domain